MSARIITATLLALVLAGGAVSAQLFSVEVSPNPVLQGQPVKFKIECSAKANTRTGCGFDAIYQGKPGGALVYQPFICPSIFITVGPGNPYSNAGWNGKDSNNQVVKPGIYYVRVDWNVGSGYNQHYVPFRVDAAIPNKMPLLTTTTATARNTTLGITINSANQPNQGYVIAASFTTNTGFQLTPAMRVDLDQDALFWFSLALPNGSIFQNFQGLLDRTGIAKASMFIPNVAAIQGAQLSLQCGTVHGTILQTTNALTRVILGT